MRGAEMADAQAAAGSIAGVRSTAAGDSRGTTQSKFTAWVGWIWFATLMIPRTAESPADTTWPWGATTDAPDPYCRLGRWKDHSQDN
jgi:hypothetical protein